MEGRRIKRGEKSVRRGEAIIDAKERGGSEGHQPGAAALASAAVATVSQVGTLPWQPHLLAINHLPGSNCAASTDAAGRYAARLFQANSEARTKALASVMNPMPGIDFLFDSSVDASGHDPTGWMG